MLQQRITIHLSIILTIFMVACSSSNNIKHIKANVPASLQNNSEIVSAINNMELAANNIITLKTNAIGVVEGKQKKTTDEDLSKGETFKLLKVSLKIVKESNKYEKAITDLKTLSTQLPNDQKEELEYTIELVEAKMDAYMDSENTNASDTELIAQHRIEKANANHLADSLDALRGYSLPETESPSNEVENVPVIFKFLLPLIVIGLFVFGIRMIFKRIKGAVKNIGYSAGEMKNTAQSLLNNPKKVTGQDKQLSDEEKQQLKNVMNMFDKKSKS